VLPAGQGDDRLLAFFLILFCLLWCLPAGKSPVPSPCPAAGFASACAASSIAFASFACLSFDAFSSSRCCLLRTWCPQAESRIDLHCRPARISLQTRCQFAMLISFGVGSTSIPSAQDAGGMELTAAKIVATAGQARKIGQSSAHAFSPSPFGLKVPVSRALTETGMVLPTMPLFLGSTHAAKTANCYLMTEFFSAEVLSVEVGGSEQCLEVIGALWGFPYSLLVRRLGDDLPLVKSLGLDRFSIPSLPSPYSILPFNFDGAERRLALPYSLCRGANLGDAVPVLGWQIIQPGCRVVDAKQVNC